MTTKTYYAKLDCYSNPIDKENLGNEYYKSFCDFMSYLTASNVASLVSWNSGANAMSASFNDRGYWDQTNPFGMRTYSLWKFHTSSTRNWEWYMYVQAVSASTTIRATFNTPISGYAEPSDRMISFNDSTVPRGMLFQAAVCFSGSNSFNPWNGSIGDGDGNASQAAGNGLMRWVSGSDDRTLYVLPRSNDVGGATSLRKDNAANLGSYWEGPGGFTFTTTDLRYHFIYDGDALIVCNRLNSVGSVGYRISYVGAFELRDVLSGSGIGDSKYGFITYTGRIPIANTINVSTNFGDIAGTLTAENGGIALPVKDAVTGSKGGIFNILGTFPNATYQPNTVVNKFEEYPIYLGFNEQPFPGLVGTFNTGLLRAMRDVQIHDTTADFSRAVFGGSTTVSDLKISVPWTGSSPPGTSTSRTGSNYTWTTDYR